ncbi:hypothetical protein B0H11DRAFT_1907358 [Mycena galericulata]|nr:hypothetical protein B0H11DRAFT_1907358 [Mycena galericulata]
MAVNRTFFVTTNDIGGSDTALTRPGRLGYHLKFHSATSIQIHSMLAAHYPGSGPETLKSITDKTEPELQNYLQSHKKSPVNAVECAHAWVSEELEERDIKEKDRQLQRQQRQERKYGRSSSDDTSQSQIS